MLSNNFLFVFSVYFLAFCWSPRVEGQALDNTDSASSSSSSPFFFGYYEPKESGAFQDVQEIDGTKLSHLLYAFGYPSSSGEILLDKALDPNPLEPDPSGRTPKPATSPTEREIKAHTYDDGTMKDITCTGTSKPLKGHLGKVFLLKQKYPHLRTIFSIGGWSYSGYFSAIFKSEAKRTKFIESATNLMLEYGFDGIDIDWEFPMQMRDYVTYDPSDWINLNLLFKEFRAYWLKLFKDNSKNFLITLCLPAVSTYDSAFQLEFLTDLVTNVDFFLLMGYEYQYLSKVSRFGSSLSFNTVRPSFPELANEFPEHYTVGNATEVYLSKIPPQKFVIGFPSYAGGKAFTRPIRDSKNCLGHPIVEKPNWIQIKYREIRELIDTKVLTTVNEVVEDSGAVACNSTFYFTMETPGTVEVKMAYAMKNQLGGLMMWDLSQDFKVSEPQSLLGGATRKYSPNTKLVKKNVCSVSSTYCNVACKDGEDPYEWVEASTASSSSSKSSSSSSPSSSSSSDRADPGSVSSDALMSNSHSILDLANKSAAATYFASILFLYASMLSSVLIMWDI